MKVEIDLALYSQSADHQTTLRYGHMQNHSLVGVLCFALLAVISQGLGPNILPSQMLFEWLGPPISRANLGVTSRSPLAGPSVSSAPELRTSACCPVLLPSIHYLPIKVLNDSRSSNVLPHHQRSILQKGHNCLSTQYSGMGVLETKKPAGFLRQGLTAKGCYSL